MTSLTAQFFRSISSKSSGSQFQEARDDIFSLSDLIVKQTKAGLKYSKSYFVVDLSEGDEYIQQTGVVEDMLKRNAKNKKQDFSMRTVDSNLALSALDNSDLIPSLSERSLEATLGSEK